MSTISQEILQYISKIRDFLRNKNLNTELIDASIRNEELILVIYSQIEDKADLSHIETTYREELMRYDIRFNKIQIVLTNHLPQSQKIGGHQANKYKIPKVNKVIVIASGKGGVGKSTITASLAFFLSSYGYSVGIADLDVYGSSIPEIFNVYDKPQVSDQGKLIPIISNNISIMSLGLLVDRMEPIIWRGPMLSKAISQVLESTDWSNDDESNKDFLIIDTPPGTGDIHMTLASKYNIDGVIAVSTSQNLSLLNAHKSIEMYKKFDVRVLGMIENMSFFSVNGHEQYIFGKDGVKDYCAKNNLIFLAQIPLLTELSSSCNSFIEICSKNSSLRKSFSDITKTLVE